MATYMLDKQCFPYNSNVLKCVVEIMILLNKETGIKYCNYQPATKW